MFGVERQDWLLGTSLSHTSSSLIGFVLLAAAIVKIETKNREGDADGLSMGRWRSKPDDGDDDDEYALD